MCRSRKDGGLGVLDLGNMNIALLAKWWWKLLSGRNFLWARLITKLYYARRRPLLEGASFTPFSYWWKSVLGSKEVFNCGAHFTLGSGKQVELWRDEWGGMTPLCRQFPDIYRGVTAKTRKVSECFGGSGWKWNRILTEVPQVRLHSCAAIRELKELLSRISPGRGKDIIQWRRAQSGAFLVKSTYDFLQDGGVRVALFDKLWVTKAPLKVKIFVWTAIKSRILTKDILSRRGWTGDGVCVFCGVAPETTNHLLADCDAIKALLGAQMLNKRFLCTGNSLIPFWQKCCQLGGSSGRHERVILVASWWSIWLERSRRIFKNKRANGKHLLETARAFRCLWESHCP